MLIKLNNSGKVHMGILTILVMSLIMFFIVFGFYSKDKSTDNQIKLNIKQILETSSADADAIMSAMPEYTTNSDKDYSYPDSYNMDIPYINQYPELPTGCEITSLCEVLNYLGYNIDKETLARNYLDMRDNTTTGCFVEYFWGSPWKRSGSGCFAPAIVKAANAFFNDNNNSYKAYVISYSPIEALFYEFSCGNPIIVWTSFNYENEEVLYNDVTLDDGTVFKWPQNEHCVALAGYDCDKQTVTLADPTYGIVERTMEEFESYYQKYFYQALTIRKN